MEALRSLSPSGYFSGKQGLLNHQHFPKALKEKLGEKTLLAQGGGLQIQVFHFLQSLQGAPASTGWEGRREFNHKHICSGPLGPAAGRSRKTQDVRSRLEELGSQALIYHQITSKTLPPKSTVAKHNITCHFQHLG